MACNWPKGLFDPVNQMLQSVIPFEIASGKV